jgi:HEAT repeat protein
LLLASGKAIKAAATEIGIGERTAHTWLEDDGFRGLVAAIRGRSFSEAVGKLSDSAGAAVDELRNLLRDPNSSVRLRAALGILDQTVRAVELLDMVERVESLERLVTELRDEKPQEVDPQVAGGGRSVGR